MSAALAAAVGMLAGLHGGGNIAHKAMAMASRAPCLKALAPVAAGTAPLSRDFSAVACPRRKAVAAAFRYDAAQSASYVIRDIARGEIVPAYPEFDAAKVMPGQPLRLVVSYGAVRVERQVEAMQAARPGQRLFVRSGDGRIFSVRYKARAR